MGKKKSKDDGDGDMQGKQVTKEDVQKQKKRFSCRKCCATAKSKIALLAKRGVLLFYVLYNILLAVALIVFAFNFRTALDVAVGRFSQLWLWTLMQVLIILTCFVGLYATIKRDPGATRKYFMVMPIIVICSFPATHVAWALRCRCNTFVQCSALHAFNGPHAIDFTIPHPVPPNIARYKGRMKLAWKPPPTNMPEPEEPSGLMDLAIGHREGDAVHTQHHVETVNGQRHFKGRASKSVNMYFDDDDFNVLDVSGQPKSDAENCSFQGRRNSSLMNGGLTVISAHGQPLLSDRPPISGASRAYSHSLVTSQVSVSPPGGSRKSPRKRGVNRLKIDPRKVYKMGIPLNQMYRSKAEGVQQENCDPKQFGFSKNNKENKNKLLACRKDPSASAATRCPDSVESKLLECVLKDTCAAIKFVLKPRNPNSNDSWVFTMCILTYPVEPSGTTLNATDDDPQWDTVNPLMLYFERDMSETLRRAEGGELVITFGRKVAPMEQAQMSSQSWISYMNSLRESGCFCTPASRGCAAHYNEEKHANEYWCKVRIEDRERCLRHQMPGGEARHMTLAPFPGSSETLWTKDVCMPAGDVYLDKQLDELKREKTSRRSDCACFPNLGYMVDKAQYSSLRPQIINAYAKVGTGKTAERILVGYKCEKWLKEDKKRWCVVGFDSACADREEISIPGSHTRLRLFKSTLPCEREELYSILDSAKQTCRLVRMAIHGLDILRYLLFFPMMFWTYTWAANRCQDEKVGLGSTASNNFVNMAAEEEEAELAEAEYDSFYSYDSYDPYDSYDSRDEDWGHDNESQPKSKAKAEGKASSSSSTFKAKGGGGAGSDSWSDDDDGAPKKKDATKKGAAPKKKSEDKGSDDGWSADEDAPASKPKDKDKGKKKDKK